MKFNPKVSIIIPVYNGENYVREAIDSALAQTYQNIEIIVVNDGSSDATEKICKDFGDKIRYFSKKNGGTSTALNIGIKNMTGEYFSWLSHDDMYYPNKIKRQIEELEKLENKNTIMMSDLDGINENYEKIYVTNYIAHINEYPLREKSYIHPIIYNQTHGCTLLIPKTCFDEVGLFDETSLVAQDFELFYRVFLKFPHKLIPEVLVTARDSSNRQGRRSKSKGSVEYSELFIKIIDNLSDQDYKLLAKDKVAFYSDMQTFFKAAGYDMAYNYIGNKMMKNLQISSYDLIGNKFNGYDLHFYLRDNIIQSKQIVLEKLSNDPNVYQYNFHDKDAIVNLIKNRIFFETDIVHLQLIHNFFDLNYLPLITRLKPTIFSLHDPFFLGGHCVHHFDCEKWKKHCYDCPYLNEFFKLDNDYSALNFEIKKQAIQNSQISVIVPSKWMEKKVKESSIWKNKKIYLLPFGINQNLFKSIDITKAKEKLNISKNKIVLMFRSEPDKFKGTDIIKDALDKIENPENITLITVGTKGLLGDLYNKFDVLEYGWINDDEKLSGLYQACDIFLMPSKQETFGLMAIEAMSCGKPVLSITGEGTSLPDVINTPHCGIAVDEKNYANELKRLINNSKERITRSEKCLEYALLNYSKDVYVKRIIEIYKEVIVDHKLDEDAKLILEQLDKYMPVGIAESPIYNNYPKEKFIRRNYKKIPWSIRKKINPLVKKVYITLKHMRGN